MVDEDLPAPPQPPEPSAPASLYLSVEGVAQRLNVSVNTVRAWRSEGKLPPAYKLGKHVRYRVDQLDRWVEARRERKHRGEEIMRYLATCPLPPRFRKR